MPNPAPSSQLRSFPGRILFLTEDPEGIRRQLRGEDLDLTDPRVLRDDISTDEITPAWTCYHFDESLGRFPYTGLCCRGEYPVSEGSVLAGGFSVSISGRRRGKGSSREASPFAEWCAGIRLVIAESFERIYRQNCQNLGILTSTDFSLIPRLQRGEALPMEVFLGDLDPMTQGLVRQGGLFAYQQARRRGLESPPLPAALPRPMNLAEKILARHLVSHPTQSPGWPQVQPGDGIFVQTDWRFSHEYVTAMAASFLRQAEGCQAQVRDASSILVFRDHLCLLDQILPAHHPHLPLVKKLGEEQERFCVEQGLQLLDGQGICHQLMLEQFAQPGQFLVGTDSHTCQAGALGCLAMGIGSSDLAAAWMSREVRVHVPPCWRIELKDPLPPGVWAKDIALYLLGLPEFRQGQAMGRILEFGGEGLRHLSTEERATLCNMAAEMGAFTGIIEPDGETLSYLKRLRGCEIPLESWMKADSGAIYERHLDVHCSKIPIMAARPGDPGLGIPLETLEAPIPIHIAYLGSCTGGKLEDLRQAAEVADWALSQGMALPSEVHFYVQASSRKVRDQAEDLGWMESFRKLGAILLDPACGACIQAGPGISTLAGQVTISSINRNFPGRSGPGQVWLASPATVAASALAGQLCSFQKLRAG